MTTMHEQIACIQPCASAPCCYLFSTLQEPGLGAKQKSTASRLKTGELLCFIIAYGCAIGGSLKCLGPLSCLASSTAADTMTQPTCQTTENPRQTPLTLQYSIHKGLLTTLLISAGFQAPTRTKTFSLEHTLKSQICQLTYSLTL